MAIYTPRGLKIRLGVGHAFTLMARLYPDVDAFKILKTTEGLESIPAMLAFIAGLVSFTLHLHPLEIGFYVFIVSVAGALITGFGLFLIPGLPKLGTIYSYLSGFGILLIVLAIYGFYSAGLYGVAAFFGGKFLAGIINNGIGFLITKRIHSQVGLALTTSEINFFNAYRLHASRLGKSTDITVTDEEALQENWKACLEDLALKWPEVVNRFTVD